MSTSERHEFVSRLEMLERKYQRVKLAGLVFLALAAVLVLSAQTSPQTKPAHARTIEVRKVVFLDAGGTPRAELGIDEGPFLVTEMVPGQYSDSPMPLSWHSHQRVVPRPYELSSRIIEDVAKQFGPKAAGALRDACSPVPALVLADANGKPSAVVETLQIDSRDPHAKRRLKQQTEMRPRAPRSNPESPR